MTPESRAYCAKLVEDAVLGEIFTPIGLKPTVLFPGTNGGANWGGASWDPETHTLYVNSMDVGMLFHMVKRPEGSQIPYRPLELGHEQRTLLGSESIPVPETAMGISDGHRPG